MQGKSQRELDSLLDLNSSFIIKSTNQVIFNGFTFKTQYYDNSFCLKEVRNVYIIQIKQYNAEIYKQRSESFQCLLLLQQ
ncbi:unnamed protein product [Paramecium primaurelia]|uniref:Uncharacterized protein n=1 Tax=Paramecium primaurelia TaxID=5886 RepID=A0A8S1PEZ2_PARPR|nr:unnamed protein product [Paramecium primaurelia]